MDDWLTAVEAAKVLGISRRHVARLAESGDLEGRKVTSHLWLVSRQSVNEWTRKRAPKGKQSE